MQFQLRSFVAAALTGAVAIGSSLTAASAEEKLLMVVAGTPPGHLNARITQHFVDLVNERGKGVVQVDLRLTDAMGTPPQVLDQLVQGTVQMNAAPLSWITPFDKDLQITDWGFTFRDNDHMAKFFASPRFEEIAGRVEASKGIKILAVGPTQAREIFSTKPIKSFDDIQGMKMRVPQIKAFWELWTAMGANPTPVAYAEVPVALKTGVAEAYEDNPGGAISMKIEEVAPNIVRTSHVRVSHGFVVNADTFAKLSPEAQKILLDAAKESAAWGTAEATTEIDGVLAKMVSGGANVVEIDTGAMRQRAADGAKKLEAAGDMWSAGLYDEIQAIQ